MWPWGGGGGVASRAIACRSGCKETQEVGFVPSGLEAFAVDADFDGLISFKQVEGQAAEAGVVLCAVVLADSSLVFIETDVQLPVQLVFHRPMPPHRGSHPGGIRLSVTADKVTPLRGDLMR